MAQSFQFEFLFDASKAEQQVSQVAKRFTEAFNQGKPFQASKAEFLGFFNLVDGRLKDLKTEYEKVAAEVKKAGGSLIGNESIRRINDQIAGLNRLKAAAEETYKEVDRVNLSDIFKSGRDFSGSTTELKTRIQALREYAKELQNTLKDTIDQLEGRGIDAKNHPLIEKVKREIEETKAELDGLSVALKERTGATPPLAQDLNEIFQAALQFKGGKGPLRAAINETKTELLSLQKQYSDTMAALEAAGQDTKGNPELEKMSIQIDQLKAKYEGLMQAFKNMRAMNENPFMGITQGASALMGAFTAAQGAISMFGVEEEKLLKVQTKLQSSMSILMGLQRMGALFNSQSQFRLQVLNKLMAKYHEWNLKVAQSEGIKRAATFAWWTVLVAVIAALTTLIIKTSKYADEVKRVTEMQKAFREEYKNSFVSEISSLTKLQAGWSALGDDMRKKQKFFYQYRNEIQSLDSSITSVSDMENKMKNGAESVVKSIQAKAEANALLAESYYLVGKMGEYMAKKAMLATAEPNGWDKALYYLTGAFTGKGWKLDFTSFDEYWAGVKESGAEKFDEEYEKYLEEYKKLTSSDAWKDAMKSLLDEGNKGFENEAAARIDAAKKGYESILRLNEDMEHKLQEARNADIMNETEREIKALEESHNRKIKEIEREKKDYIEKLREQAKLEYKAANPLADEADVAAYGRNWKPSPEQQQKIDEYYEELAQLEGNAYNRAQRRLYDKLQESKWAYWQEYGTLGSKEKAIIERYESQIRDAQDNNDLWKELSLNAKKEEELWQLRNNSRIQYLEQYGSYREKELAIIEKYDHIIENETDDFNKKMLEAQKEQALLKLKQSSAGNIIFWDEKQLSRNTLKKALTGAEKELNRLLASGRATNEEINVMLQRVQSLRDELENTHFLTGFDAQGFIEGLFKIKQLQEQTAEYQKKIKWFGEDEEGYRQYKQLIDQTEEATERQKEALRGALIGAGVGAFASAFQTAADAMQRIAEIAGDTKFKDFADQFSALAQNFSAAGQGAATGGWIGAIVGGATDLINQTVQALSEAPALEAQAKKNAEDWAMALKNVAVAMDNIAYESPFGERTLAKGREAMRSSLEATKRYNEELAELNKKYSEQNIEKYTQNSVGGTIFGFGAGGLIESLMGAGTGLGFLVPLLGLKKDKISNEFKAYEEAISKGYDGLRKMLVKTKDRSGWANLFGFQDEYQALGDLYPQLFKDGELVIEQAKLLLETNNALDDSQKEQIKNLVELKEKYEEAMKAIDDVISETFNNISADIIDIIWDSVMNGTDAWAEFKKVGASAITSLGKQLMQEMLISTYLDNFKEEMREAYKSGDMTQTQEQLRDITGRIFGGLSGVFDGLVGVAQNWKDWAEQEGYDLTEAQERSTASKAISGVSQETFNEMSGRVTSIQLSAYNIDETTKAIHEAQVNLLAVTAQILYEVQGIHRDTERMQDTLDTMSGDMTLVKSNLGTIADKGVRMLN